MKDWKMDNWMCSEGGTGLFGVVLKVDLKEEVDMKEKERSETN